ncbi:TonB-dependent receptor plug domain-containing protein [Methylobacterium oryzae CBMB20]
MRIDAAPRLRRVAFCLTLRLCYAQEERECFQLHAIGDAYPDRGGPAAGRRPRAGPGRARRGRPPVDSARRAHGRGAQPGPIGGWGSAAGLRGGQIARGGRIRLLGNKDSLQTPFSTASYTAQTIRDQQAVSVAEILTRLDPSVRASIGSGNRYDAVTIRGFRVENREFALNGLYGLVPDYRINPAPIERIELLKGPSAFLFGVPLNGSVGGTVNVVTKRAGDAPLTRATVDYASAAIAGTQFDVARRYGEEAADRHPRQRRDARRRYPDRRQRAAQRRRLAGAGLYRGPVPVHRGRDRPERPLRPADPRLLTRARLPDPRAPDPRINLAQRFDFSDAESLTALGRAEYDLTRDITLFAALGSNRFAYDKQESPSPTLLDAAGNASSVSVFQSGQTRTLSGEAGARARFETGSIGHEAVFTATVLDQDLTLGQITYPRYRTNIYAGCCCHSPDCRSRRGRSRGAGRPPRR